MDIIKKIRDELMRTTDGQLDLSKLAQFARDNYIPKSLDELKSKPTYYKAAKPVIKEDKNMKKFNDEMDKIKEALAKINNRRNKK